MLITLLVIGYILIACVIGCAIYVYCDDEDCDIAGVFGGLFWPLTIVFIILCKFFTFLCSNICKVFEYLKNEGFHYCKEDVPPCCGKCKYMYYWNDHDELNGCRLYKGHSHMSSSHIHCEEFKQHWLWRFRIRYKWDEKVENK
jgi:hypothetical protein